MVMCIISLVSLLQCWSKLLAQKKFQARNDSLDEWSYPKLDLVNTWEIGKFYQKERRMAFEKKISKVIKLQLKTAKTSRNNKKNVVHQLEKKILDGVRREHPEKKSLSRIFNMPMSRPETKLANRFLMKNKVYIMPLMIMSRSVSP